MKRLLLFLLVIFLAGCNANTDSDIPVILAEKIFEIKAKEYFVLLVQDDCAGCKKAKPAALAYHRASLLKTELPKIYLVNMSGAANRIIVGERGEEVIDGISSISELRITQTPTLIVIKEGMVSEHYIKTSEVMDFLDGARKK